MVLRRTLAVMLAAAAAVNASTFDVTFTTAGHNVPSTLCTRSGDGGLYAELIQNRAFQQVTPGTSAALTAWAALGSAKISVVASSSPVSSALPNALSFAVPSGSTSTVGFTNSGYFGTPRISLVIRYSAHFFFCLLGIPVTAGWTYTGSFYYRTPTPPATKISGSFTADLRSTSGTVFTSTTVPFTTSSTWQQATFTFTASSTQSAVTNLFALSVGGSTVAGLTMEFTLISLFPPTFNGRKNGFRMDLSETLLDMKPAFFRFPGGNNLEGETAADRWAWENTVGDLVDRPGRVGDWGYINTDGLGLYEYLQWIEDMDMQPIMAVYAGYSLNGASVASNDMQTYITEAINQINFVIGDASTNAQAAIRSSMGHPDPFTLNYIEIGNEDFFSPTTYADYRWADLYNALHAEFPQLHYIATSATSGNVPSLSPAPTYWDLHIYSNPNFFINGAYNFDILSRNGLQFFQGEYATTTENSGAALTYPFIDGSIAEAAYMAGFDRNSDIVFAASYAPLLNHVSSTQWTPDLITFSPNTVIRSTSYYVQQLYSLYKGDFYLTSTTNTASSPVQWSVTRDTSAGQYFLKVINTATSANTVVFTLPFTPSHTTGTGTILTAASGTQNTPTNPNAAVPSSFSFTAGKTITYNAPGLSLSVLVVTA
ncbi:glycoside hydrolase family 51 protein [Lentinula edodes]|uniref:glycoside hydrolase family 51 protein n=1 Tax=Lentinula edodes TaxID=5353 RepID=UPI001E8DADAD|nr:glycoside hydrolase family 51 protein [Lentinula edodes]KAH7874179.1 glycoside hydrolase family 51 protein [Lentinula edodes]